MKKNINIIKTSILSLIIGSAVGLSLGVAIPVTSSIVHSVTLTVSTTNVNTTTTKQDSNDLSVIQTLDEESQNTVNIIKKVKPSIACITSVVQGTDFFNQSYESEGSGSGIVFYKDSQKAYIATNYHVISGASRVSISLNECDLVSTELVGKDANSDLAVISVKLSDLAAAGVKDVQVAEFGDSDSTQVGDTVIAIGNALGQGNTATKGIISVAAKEVNINGKKLTVLQTDAAINPGNSGGALVNQKGQVIGINTAKIALTSVEGVGYSIASNVAEPLIEQLMNTTDSATLGVSVVTITDEMAQYYNLPTAGVMVQEVVQGGSAAQSGIKQNDIITSFNGQPTFTNDQLVSLVKNTKVGDIVNVKLIRNGQTLDIKVKMLKSSGF
ncbi:MAG: trypsin-like peptidase domain-containing protein [Clostridia bacterium]|nr:trypsin-like peptidase domain-containing protein [Clostridia bacterium]